MNEAVRRCRNFIVSLKLTVVLLAIGLVLIFAATLSQVDLGIWAVQQQFFRSFVAIWHVGKLYVPLPGGYLVGGLLLVNLIAAHIYRFKLEGRKIGIFLTHIGLILLLIGELLSGLWQEDYTMQISHGETKNYAQSLRNNELAIIDTTDANHDVVTAVPEEMLAAGGSLQHATLPFRINLKAYFPNARFVKRGEGPAAVADYIHANQGYGQQYDAVTEPLASRADERNLPAAYLELVGANGPIGTWLVWTNPQLPTQSFEYNGHSYKIALRFERIYQPFALTLIKFSHDVYVGTDLPKNFSSRVRLHAADGSVDREVLIYMNNPLRYGGLTFFQADYDHEKDSYTVLQVVENPSWLLPYLACSLMALGLVVQFGIHLLGFAKRRVATARTAVA